MKQITDFLIDISDKMDKKLSITQRILTDEIAPNFDFSGVFGMRIFKSVCGSPIIIKSLDLAEPNTKSDFITKATSLPLASGGSPIAATVKESMESLKALDADEKKIILITAGEDTDGGVLEYEVEKLALGIQVNIIGISMKDSDLRSAQKAAQLTSGVCCNIPEDKLGDPFAIRELVAPVINAMNTKCTPTAAPKQEAPKAEVKPEPVAQPKVEQKEEPKIEVKEEPKVEAKEEPKAEAPRMAAFMQQPAAQAQPQQVAQEKKPAPQIINKNFAKEAESVQGVSVSQSSARDNFDAVSALQNANQDIESLLKTNMETLQRVLKENESLAKENEQLRAAEKSNLDSISQLQNTAKEANETIQQLHDVISDKEAEIEALNANKRDLQVAINQWKERDKKVVIDLDAAARQAVSAASEKLLFDYLEKKYPNRVKWCNEKTKNTNGYDFEIVDFENNTTEYYIACKGAKDDSKTFFLTEKEWDMCLNNNRNYQVYLIRNVEDHPKIILIDNLIGCLMTGKVRPGASKNEKVKAGQVMMTIK